MRILTHIGLSAALLCAAFIPQASDSGPFGCTIVMAARNGFVLAGSNEDRNHPKTIVTLDRIMSGAKELSVDLIRDILGKIHQEGNSLTVYSSIYDLKQGTIDVYSLWNSEEVVVMNLSEELKKGQRRLDLPLLFKPRAQG